MIAIDQDPLVYQARRLKDYGDQEVWARPLMHTMSGKVAVALLNRSATAANISFNVDSVGLKATKGYTIRDVWAKTTSTQQTQSQQSFRVPPHGIIVLVLTGESSLLIFSRKTKPALSK